MNRTETCQDNLKSAYLNYFNNNLADTLICLDKVLEAVLQDNFLNNEPFWKTISSDILKAIILNNFYNHREVTINDLELILSNPEEIIKNINEFCNNFNNNEFISFIPNIENIKYKIVSDAANTLISNINDMNVDNISSETTDIEIVSEFIDNIEFNLFKKTDSFKSNNKLFDTYNVKLFQNEWFTYDFMLFARKYYPQFTINFSDIANNVVTENFTNDNLALAPDIIQELCQENRLNFSITYNVNGKPFTIMKPYNKSELVFVTSLDTHEFNMSEAIDTLKQWYTDYICCDHTYITLDSLYNNKKVDSIFLFSSFKLIIYMLSLEENEYDVFYEENVKWLENKFDFISKDKDLWKGLLNRIVQEILTVISVLAK